jgi:hypothetical protein
VERARLEFEDDSGLGAKIALGAVADYDGVAEAGMNVINFDGAEGDVLAERDVEAAAEDEVEGIVVRQSAEVDTFALGGAAVEDIRVDIVVCSAEHKLRKRLDALEVEAQDRANGVSEQVAVNGQSAIGLAIAALGIRGHSDDLPVAAVVRELGFEADVFEEEVSKGYAAAIERRTGDEAALRSVQIGIIHGDLYLRRVLGESGGGEENGRREQKQFPHFEGSRKCSQGTAATRRRLHSVTAYGCHSGALLF